MTFALLALHDVCASLHGLRRLLRRADYISAPCGWEQGAKWGYIRVRSGPGGSRVKHHLVGGSGVPSETRSGWEQRETPCSPLPPFSHQDHLIPPGSDPVWHPAPTHKKLQKYYQPSAGAAGGLQREARIVIPRCRRWNQGSWCSTRTQEILYLVSNNPGVRLLSPRTGVRKFFVDDRSDIQH